MTTNFWGIVKYEIIGDGCLNGIWNNNDTSKNGVIMNEIARKKDKDKNNIEGEYSLSWIEPDQDPIVGTLSIKLNGIAYEFEWNIDKRGPVYKGIGLMVGEVNLIAFYWKFNETFNIQ